MALFVRQGVIAVALGAVLFCMSCEKHPVGQMPEVQREQPDPAKAWLKTEGETEKSSTSHESH